MGAAREMPGTSEKSHPARQRIVLVFDVSAPADFRPVEANLDPVDLLDAASDRASRGLKVLRHIDAMDIHDGVVAASAQ
jgi:hypothetical protein